MSATDRNLAAIRALDEAFNRHDRDTAAALFSNAGADLSCRGIDAFASPRRLGGFNPTAAQLESKETIAVGDDVVERLIYSGRDAANGKPFAVQHIHWWTLKDGSIVGHKAQRDDIAMLMQVGRLPAIPMVVDQAYLAEGAIEHRNIAGGMEQERNLSAILANRRAHIRKDMDAVLAGFADDAQNHGRARGREGMRRVIGDIFATFSPVTSDDGIDAMVAVDDCVVVQFRRQVRHTGTGRLPINGGLLIGVPPTNKVYTERHVHWWTSKEGFIVQHRACRDDVGMMIDLGLWPLQD